MVNKTKVYPVQDITVDTQIGAVEIKDGDSDQRATVGLDGDLVTNPLGNLVRIDWDFIAITAPTTLTDLFTYKIGGSGGTTVLLVTVTYASEAKINIITVEKA